MTLLTPSHDGMATVTRLTPRPAPARAVEILERRIGAGWDTLPADAGRPALRAELLLREAPAGFDPAGIDGSTAVDNARRLIVSARTAIDLLADEVVLLSEALGADLGLLALDELDAVASAVLGLNAAPTPSPSWGRRADAESAEVVLGLLGPALREAADAHAHLYEQFTDHVWSVPAPLLAAGARRGRWLSHARLRRQLRDASRTGAVQGSIASMAQEIIAVRATRARLAAAGPLLAHHLGRLDRGVLTDVDATSTALAAVRRLQRSMEAVLDDERLEHLLEADAFRSEELLAPSRAIRTALAAWSRDVDAAGGRGALAVHTATLGRWADDVELHLAAVECGLQGMERIGRSESSLQQVVDALLLCEHVTDLAVDAESSSDTTKKTWSAS